MNSKAIVQPPLETRALEEASTRVLVKEALDEAKELVKLEVALAKTEMTRELEQAKKAAIFFGVTVVFGAMALCLFAVALVLALGGTAIVAVLVAAGFLGIGIMAAGVGYFMLPTRPFEHTRRRLETDLNQLKEHLA